MGEGGGGTVLAMDLRVVPFVTMSPWWESSCLYVEALTLLWPTQACVLRCQSMNACLHVMIYVISDDRLCW